jgi:hypothetical protein
MARLDAPPWDDGPATVVAPIYPGHIRRMGKFHGNIDQLKDKLLPLNLDGQWEEQPNGVWKFKCRDRAGVLWSQTKGTVWFDGPSEAKDGVQAKVEAALDEKWLPPAPDQNKQVIFVVHGRDTQSKDQLELILHRLGLDPFILQNVGGGGDTLIEALERMIGKVARERLRDCSNDTGRHGLSQ